jgi:phage FluMu gp28-like protein
MTENLILDEFAHHHDNRAIWTALLPVVSRPDLKMRVISTPNGKGDKFYEIMTSPELAGTFSRHLVTIHDAVADGLPRNIEELRRAMADPMAWAQEFECDFVDEATAWIPYDLIDGCEDAEAGDPAGYAGGPCYIGMDFAARGDLTVIAVLELTGGRLLCREIIELRGVAFSAQLAELDRVMAYYRVARAALDQTGMGEMPVQEAKRRHGNYRVEGVLFSLARKLDLATALKEAMEDRRLAIPMNTALRADLHAVQRVPGATGAPRLVAERTDMGHADRFWALALACGAAKNPAAPIEYTPAPPKSARWDGTPGPRGRRDDADDWPMAAGGAW